MSCSSETAILTPGAKADKYFNETGDGKLLLRKAFARYMPDAYAKGKKQGFSAPDGSWFRGRSIDYIRTLLSKRVIAQMRSPARVMTRRPVPWRMPVGARR